MLKLKLKQVDARGLSCPQPVLLAKKAIEANPQGAEILVDNITARDNVTRFGKNAGYKVEVEKKGDDYILALTK